MGLSSLNRVLIVTAVLLAVFSSALCAESAAQSYEGELYPLADVKRGQKGYGYTTFKGTTPERFEFEVIGVNRNFLAKMDIILVKSDDPKVAVTGFWQGMSGSPLYLEGKLLCAFSYGFRFNKRPIGGCTPIHYMLKEGLQARRGAPNVQQRSGPSRRGKAVATSAPSTTGPNSAASLASWLKLVPNGDVAAVMRRSNTSKPWLLRDHIPRRSTPTIDNGMQAASVPLALSGFTPQAFQEAKEMMEGFPLIPMQAGGTGSPSDGPSNFTMGGSIAVQMVRGDMSAAATGTVSYIDGDNVLAFGHPMFQAGEFYAPVSAAEVHTVIPSAQNAFVLASPLRELGALTQDRQSCIAADTSLKVDMIPMKIHIREKPRPGGGTPKTLGTFNVEILDSRFFTPTFAMVAASNAAGLYLTDRTHVTLRMRSKVEIEGHKALEFVDYLHSSRGAGLVVGNARGLRVISPLMNNPFSPVKINSIALDLEVSYDANMAEIAGISIPSSELHPGQRNTVNVKMKPFQGEEFTETIEFDVPQSLAGSIVRLEVTSGDNAGVFIAPPKTLSDLIAAFRQLLPGTVYTVTLYSAEEAAAVNGRIIEDLPSSALNRLRTSTRTPLLSTRRLQTRTIHPGKRVIEGEVSVLVKVGMP